MEGGLRPRDSLHDYGLNNKKPTYQPVAHRHSSSSLLSLFQSQFLILAGLDGCNGGQNLGRSFFQKNPIVARELKYRNFPALQVLLVTDALIASQKKIELGFRQFQELAVLDSSPTFLHGIRTGVPHQMFAQWPGGALVEQDPHAAVRISSERSKTLQTMALVTEGKHSTNFSTV